MTRKRLTDEAVAAALIQQGSNKAAADLLGCAVRTIIDRKRQPAFQKIYAKARAAQLQEAAALIQRAAPAAVTVLCHEMMNEQNAPQIRINAAVSVLQYGMRLTEQADVLTRLEELEAEVKRE